MYVCSYTLGTYFTSSISLKYFPITIDKIDKFSQGLVESKTHDFIPSSIDSLTIFFLLL